MRLLLVSDVEDLSLWDYFDPHKVAGVDAILSCGDLKSDYLEFLVTVMNKPLYYVHGNHDEIMDRFPPEGCECVDKKLFEYKGYRILAFGGCMRYHLQGVYQYTESEMKSQVKSLRRAIKKAGGFDILMTHTAAANVDDMDDLCHSGFSIYRELLDTYSPMYHIHGHIHLNYGIKVARTSMYKNTTVINTTGKYFLDLPDR